MGEPKNKFQDLHTKIQNLINSHQNLRKENQELRQELVQLEKTLHEERDRVSMMQEGFEEFRELSRGKTRTQISGLKTKVNEMISEIDRSVALIESNHK